ncbi:hypothetical protein HID58_043167 [Brassica napus]|uniref:Uncharacterized protein n=1 Tax=Brassica napus TaxID=3708 RepID=A0ABQ8BFQ1_BRANA|nr:hypothetical protein HID58_043167 [Brassica napus]
MSSPPGEQTRVTAELAGEHNHATVDLASDLTGAVAELAGRVQPHVGSARRRPARWLSSPCECNHMAVQLADELTGVMVELAGGNKSPGDATPLAESAVVPVQVPEVSAQPSDSSTTQVPAPKEEKAMELMPPPLDRKEIVLGLSASSAAPVTKSRKRTGAATETVKKRICTAGAEGEPSGPLSQHRAKRDS